MKRILLAALAAAFAIGMSGQNGTAVDTAEQRLSSIQNGIRMRLKKTVRLFVQTDSLLHKYGAIGNVPADALKQMTAGLEDAFRQQEEFFRQSLEENRDNLIPARLIAQYGKQIETYSQVFRNCESLSEHAAAAHADSIPAHVLFSALSHLELQWDDVSRFLETYPYKDHDMLQPIRQEIALCTRTRPGKPFTDFTMAGPDGTPRRLSDFVGKGKYVLADFWASWCGPCRAEMPSLREAYNRYAAKGLEIVGISLDSDKRAWMQATEQMGITWPQLSDLKGWKNEAAVLYGIHSIPATILFDPEGNIVATGLRSEALRDKLAEIFK